MSVHAFVSELLTDHSIDAAEVAAIRQQLLADGALDQEDVKLLVELYCRSRDYCGEFEDLVFDVLERVLLADGQISPSEQYYLLKILYSDRQIRPRERELLRQLQKRLPERSAEFDALCREAFRAPDTNWDVGGRK